MSEVATRGNAVVTLPEKYLTCRDLRHAWTRQGDGEVRKERGLMYFTRVVVCVRCGTERKDRYRVSRSVVKRLGSSYHYAGGYTVKGGLSVQDARVALFSRVIWGD